MPSQKKKYNNATELTQVIGGMKVTDLTQLLHGLPNPDIHGVENYSFQLKCIIMLQIIDSLSIGDVKKCLLLSKIDFDKKNNELLITDNNYNYSYVFSFKSGFWHKINESYKILINSYPELLVLRENSSNDGVFSISLDSNATTVKIMLQTKPCEQNNENYFIVLHRTINIINLK